jgi:hypothetical protein
VVAGLGQSRPPQLQNPVVMAQYIARNRAPQLIALLRQTGKLGFVLRRPPPRFRFFLLDFSRLFLQFDFRCLQSLLVFLDVQHAFQDLVLDDADFLLGKADLMHQGLVLIVGLDLERLVAVLGNLLLQRLNINFQLAAVGLVSLDSGPGALDLRLGIGQLGFDFAYTAGQGGDFVLQALNLPVGLLELD